MHPIDQRELTTCLS